MSEIHFVEQPKSNGLSAIIDLLNQEIEWCENNRGISGKGEDFECGFLGGPGQAIYLVEQAKRVLAGLPPSNNRSKLTGGDAATLPDLSTTPPPPPA